MNDELKALVMKAGAPKEMLNGTPICLSFLVFNCLGIISSKFSITKNNLPLTYILNIVSVGSAGIKSDTGYSISFKNNEYFKYCVVKFLK